MCLRPSTVVKTLTTRHPEVEKILEWYGIRLSNGSHKMTLEDLCRAFNQDVEDVLTDIAAVLQEDEEDGWDDFASDHD